jgi:hypothetical protein
LFTCGCTSFLSQQTTVEMQLLCHKLCVCCTLKKYVCGGNTRQHMHMKSRCVGAAFTQSVVSPAHVHGVQAANTSMVELMIDLDTLLATSAGFLLGQWISDARKLATSAGHPEDQDFLQHVHDFANFPAILPYVCILARTLVHLAERK